mmetsp:Transcript_25953/g.31998  ORF Transcript_25953/g.31998 Transcript_25953/m.31998 type:complete len:187 (-) Transcript_25953:41-601(-)
MSRHNTRSTSLDASPTIQNTPTMPSRQEFKYKIALHPGERNSARSTMDQLLEIFSAQRSGVSTAANTTSNFECIVNSGWLRVTNEFNGIQHDIPFGLGTKTDINEIFFEVLKKAKNHVGDIDSDVEERVFGVRVKSGEEAIYTKEDAKSLSLSFIISSSGISRGDLLHVKTSKRMKKDYDNIELSP